MSARNMAKRTAAGTLALAVCLGGGALALAGAAQADANFKFDTRIQGDDRYATAIAASKAAFPDGTKTDNVVLVNGYATVDGLTASYLAGVANAPILYVSDKGADADTKAEIKRLGAKNIWLVGGTTVIPTSVETAIKGDGYNVTRINGSDRYETAELIAEAGAKISGKKPSKVFVASGTSFADALAVSPIAYAKGYAIVLTEKDSTSDYSKKALGNIGTDTKILVGGPAVVSSSVEKNLTISTRIAGDDRAVTANLVSDWAKKSEGFNPANAALVGGANGNGADSLVAASLGAKSLTTLHFAGWDATYTYLSDHSAELTGKGFIFGGKAAVAGDQVDKAQSAAQKVAVAAGFIVTAYTGGTTSFTYADPAAKAAAKISFSSADKYFVGGVAATQGAFAGALSAGDVVTIVKGSGSTTFSLTNKTAADYTKGLVGGMNMTNATVGSLAAYSFSINDVVTGAALNPSLSYDGNFVIFTVDGTTVSKSVFETSLQVGDSIDVKGTGADASNIRTVALTNASVSGKVATKSGNASPYTFTVKTDAGAELGDFTTASTYTFKLDGAASTQGAVETALSVGDSVTVSKASGVTTVALVNSAPTSISGVVKGDSTSSVLKYWNASGDEKTVTYASALVGGTYVVDGNVASSGEFLAAVSPGDLVTYQAADTATSTVASLSLTSKPLSGKVTAATSTTVKVATSDGYDLTPTAVDYTTNTGLYASGTSRVYTVDGVTKTQAQFVSTASGITSGALKGTITASVSSGVVTWALATTPWTEGAGIADLTFTPSATGTTATVVFDKPVTNTGTFDAADFTVTTAAGGTVPAAVSGYAVTGTTGKSVVLTFAQSATTAGNLKVTLSAAGAAKLTDVNGTASVASTITK